MSQAAHIPMVNLAARHAALGPTVEERVIDVLRSGRWVGGPVVAEAERIAANLFGRSGAVGVNSGTDALILGLQALGVRPDDEVILPAVSFFATVGAVLAIGATPVVVDVGEDGCLDAEAARRAQTRKSRAIIAVHLFGTLSEPPDLGIAVLDDSAQAVGGAPPRVRGVLTAVSTYPTKTWGSAGDGGFVVGDNTELLAAVRELANHGLWDRPHVHRTVRGNAGRNSRLDTIQAAILVAQAPVLEARVERRRAIARRYDATIPDGFRPLPRDAGSPVHHYPLRHRNRQKIRDELHLRGIETAIYYPVPLHRQPALCSGASCPVAEALCEEIFAIPVHEGLSDDDVGRILRALEEAAP